MSGNLLNDVISLCNKYQGRIFVISLKVLYVGIIPIFFKLLIKYNR